MNIKYLHRKDIDTDRWDEVIAASPAETVYSYSWYLDACAEHWGALIMPDYEYVMPVAFRKKFGFKYIYQPRFCQQLGVFSEKEVEKEVTGSFLQALSKHFKLGDYAMNEGNLIEEDHGYKISVNTNYTLELSALYEKLHQGYTENCRRNVRKAYRSELTFTDDLDIQELVLLKKQHDQIGQPDAHYRLLTDMFTGMKESGNVKAFGVKQGTRLCAGAVFAFGKKRVHYLLSVSTGEGKEQSGMFLVIDQFIQLNAGRSMSLDFEGSNIPSIARFFAGFGAQPQSYQRISFNNAAGKLLQKVRDVRSG